MKSSTLLKAILISVFFIGFTSNVFAGPMDDLLFNAVRDKDINMVRTALQNGANVNYKVGTTTPLSIAVGQRDVAMAAELLRKGALIDVGSIGSGFGKQTHIIVAVRNNDFAMVELLVTAGESIKACDEDGETPISWAASKGNYDMVKYLISKNADVNVTNNYGSTPLMDVVNGYESESRLLIAEMLLRFGADPKKKNSNMKTALQIAIDRNYKDMINLLLPISPK